MEWFITVNCYSAKYVPSHWKANVMLIISGGVTDACNRTHNCSHEGTQCESWMELLILSEMTVNDKRIRMRANTQTYTFNTPQKKCGCGNYTTKRWCCQVFSSHSYLNCGSSKNASGTLSSVQQRTSHMYYENIKTQSITEDTNLKSIVWRY